MIDPRPVVDWLVQGAPGAAGPQQVIHGLCVGLVKAGAAIDRMEAFVKTLHPSIVGRSFVWTPERPEVEVRDQSWAWLQSAEYLGSPMSSCCLTGELERHRLEGTTDPTLAPLAREGYRDFVAAPMKFLSGPGHPVTFATKRPGGFREEDVAAIRAIVPPLARIGEILALLRTATNLLSTYVGHNAGSRILAGQIQLGDTDTLRAVVWFSDLRGFTPLARTAAPQSVIRALNDLFACQIPAIEKRGGEVLKFLGDGLLAIFPYADDAAAPGRCDAALAAATEALGALEGMNARRAADGEPPIAFGVALHPGELSYGNIGGSSRLDFTCIGPAVNLAARLQTLAGQLSRAVVVSEAFAKLSTRPLEDLGAFELKGLDGSQRAFTPKR
ncbi:MAG: adenylate/guanylate cyclase domain-containing protein [Planctomycetes bacterium]|nr:adenylate/guanylate cyclase domain-containing protein [Planctomycetota bacterium]